MKKIVFLTILLIIPAISSISYAYTDLRSVDMIPSDSLISVGDSFSVSVYIAGATLQYPFPVVTLDHFGFDVSNSNISVVSLDSWNLGPGFMVGAPTPMVTGASNTYNILNPAQNYLLATLNFTALTAGNSTIGVFNSGEGPTEGLFIYEYLSRDENGAPHNFINYQTIKLQGSLDIGVEERSETPPVPEPATMLLLSLGLVGLVGIRRTLQFR